MSDPSPFKLRLVRDSQVFQLTDTSPKPKRKRRRWIIACVLLFVVSVAGWWYWPRGDARFVGNWALRYDGESARGLKLFLGANGYARYYGVVPQITYQTTWSIDGNVLTVGKGLHPALNGRGSYLATLLGWFGLYFLNEPSSHEIVSISDSQIVLRSESRTQPLILSRIPE